MIHTLHLNKLILLILLGAFSFLAALAFFGSDSISASRHTDAARAGLVDTAGNAAAGDESDLRSIIGTVVGLLSLIVGAVSVIMIIVGGLKFVTSSGDSSKIQSARSTIIYALVGLIVVAFAQVIVRFVINRVAKGPTPPTTTVPADPVPGTPGTI